TTRGFAVVGARARLFGGDASFEGGSQADGSVRFTGQGTVSAEGLRKVDAAAGALARAAAVMRGQTSYSATLGFVNGHAEVGVTSQLAGLALDLPAPLNKAADTPLALRFQTRVDPASTAPGETPRDTVRFELDKVVQAQYVRDISGAEPRVLRGGIGVMEPAPEPASGVAASINLKTFVLDEWAAADTVLEPGDGGARGVHDGYAPETIGLRVQELVAGPRRLTRVSAGLSREAGVWRASLDADQLNGYVEYRPPSRRGAATAGGRVFARLSRLSLPKSDVEQVESLLDQQPSSLPALDVVVEDFELRGKKLGRVEIQAVNRSTLQGRDSVRDWELSKFNISTPEAQFTAIGHWSTTGGASSVTRRSVMDFNLNVSNGGALLDRLGTEKAVRGGKGRLSGQIEWLGSPFAPDYPSLAGQIKVEIDAGQFLKVDPGAARLLGVLSLQSLPRRLSLDFRDLFQQGFAFDSINGDVQIAQGVAKTNNLRMRGVQALVLMEGTADIERETQDLRVVVVPEINAGTAALAYAVINPVIGLSAFLAQAILKKPLTEAGTREFHVSGPWAEPKVARVDRRSGEDVSSGDTPISLTRP
ncbi:MAG: AsmA-like C-terminal region-containing protein, partial [Burkholderiaceae bacterium]